MKEKVHSNTIAAGFYFSRPSYAAIWFETWLIGNLNVSTARTYKFYKSF